MKKILLIAFALGICTLSFAQNEGANLTLIYENNELAANDTMRYLALDNEFEFYFAIRNNGSELVHTQCTITPIDANGLSVTGICAGECMPGYTSEVFDIAAGQTYSESHALITIESYQPSYLLKLSVVDTNYRNEPVEAYMLIENGTAVRSTEDNGYINLYPNPAREQLNITYSLPDNCTNATLELCNMLGAVVKTISLSNHNDHIQLNLAGLPAGLYTATIKANGQHFTTTKVVVR